MSQAQNRPLEDSDLGEPSNLATLYRDHVAWLRTALRRRFGPESAEDLAQETYLRAATWPGLAQVRHPRALLMKIATNAAHDQMRSAAVRPRTRSEPEAFHRFADPGAPLQAEALLLKQIVLALPADLRAVFLLSRFAGLTYAEIAQRCGISQKTVEWRMTKALAICADRMRD